jgi:hypothetical protein
MERQSPVSVGAKNELQFQAIRQQIYLGLAHNRSLFSPQKIQEEGITDNYVDLTYPVPTSGDQVYYNRAGDFRTVRGDRVWTPSLRNTVYNLYEMMNVDASTQELEEMTFKMLRDWRYETLGVPGGDGPQAGGELYTFGSLDG